MNRRGFLKQLAFVPIGAVWGDELSELLQPKKTIFLPPRGGWHDHGVWLPGNSNWTKVNAGYYKEIRLTGALVDDAWQFEVTPLYAGYGVLQI